MKVKFSGLLAAMMLTLCFSLVAAAQEPRPAGLDPLTLAGALEQAYIRVASQVEPSVVKIWVTRKATTPTTIFREGRLPRNFELPPEFRWFFPEPFNQDQKPRTGEPRPVGSGFVIDRGWIATNSHVVSETENVWVEPASGRKLDVKKQLVDPLSDCAFLEIDAQAANLQPLPLGDSAAVKVGSIAIAVGNPFSKGISFNVGVVSGLGRSIGTPLTDAEGNPVRQIPNLIQHDAAINPGNSGGPLVNLRGEVIGMNTAIYNRAFGAEGIGWAIPSNLIKKIFGILRDKGKVERGWLGIALEEKTPEEMDALGARDGGAYVLELTAGGPAEKSELAAGDVIIKYDPTPGGAPDDTVVIRNNQDLIDAVEFTSPGTQVELTVIRLNEQKTVRVTLGTFPLRWGAGMIPLGEGQAGDNILGLAVRPLTAERRKQLGIPETIGLQVVAVDQGSVADQAGIVAGDALLSIDRTFLKTVADFQTAVAALAGQPNCVLRWVHSEDGMIRAYARQVTLPRPGGG